MTKQVWFFIYGSNIMDITKKKVLVIDDQQEIRELVSVTLRGTEFDVIKADGGREGIRIAREEKPDVILLDLMMPGLDGFAVSNFFKRMPDTQDIPIIFLTAKKTKKGLNIALKQGAVDYIMKPFDPDDLLTRVRRALEFRK